MAKAADELRHIGQRYAGLAAKVARGASSLKTPLLVSVGYYLGAEIAFYIGTSSDQIFALFWPPNVILFFALVTAPQSRWWVYLAAVFLLMSSRRPEWKCRPASCLSRSRRIVS
jgi:hypothetical protein